METELERLLLKSLKKTLLSYSVSHPESFDEALQLVLNNKAAYAWRASWFIGSCMLINDKRIQNHLMTIIDELPKRPNNQKREILKILFLMEIDESLEGKLFDHCERIWLNVQSQASLRLNAFKMLIKIAQKHPELFPEIELITQKQYLETLSPGVSHCVLTLMADFWDFKPKK